MTDQVLTNKAYCLKYYKIAAWPASPAAQSPQTQRLVVLLILVFPYLWFLPSFTASSSGIAQFSYCMTSRTQKKPLKHINCDFSLRLKPQANRIMSLFLPWLAITALLLLFLGALTKTEDMTGHLMLSWLVIWLLNNSFNMSYNYWYILHKKVSQFSPCPIWALLNLKLNF